ncbi:MAG TPA: hypothetical protein VE093_06100 [Polyangiaceae bacterium]|jgi:hypothetical protein|nr:hypothetical protein [Polyangiaceae bacterium]
MSDDVDIEETMTSSINVVIDPRADFRRLLGELEWLLKDGSVISALTSRGINASIALYALEGLRAYLVDDDKVQAAQDFSTVAEEIFSRLAASAISEQDGGGSGS